ncbi:hypothetical protein [Streptacidiphilus griseoplanus]|uniref:hypothetical protein n=1 Tax=Peterkaempfera griseoplana TaxID=66896 RepID=UPI000A7FFCA3|nr:hypothetical protein [Peterkaempfera griseoplana]
MEHSVIAHFALGGESFGDRAQREVMFRAEQHLRAAVEQAGAGEVDGNEFGGGRVAIYAYGPDADVLFAAMESELRALPFRPAHVYLNRGDDSQRTRIDL